MAVALRLHCMRCLSSVLRKMPPSTRIQVFCPSRWPPPLCLSSPTTTQVAAYTRARVIRPLVYDEGSARDFIYSLEPAERETITRELQKFEEERKKREGTQVRDRTDSPSFHDFMAEPESIFALPGVSTEEAPSAVMLRFIALHNSLPFIGFGFLDNFLMIVAGEYIDAYLGAALGISTMAAAGLGNLISDVAGIGSASYVEVMAAKVGVKAPPLTPHQADMKCTRRAANIGKAIGVVIGCLLGMFPLLFFRDKDGDAKTDTKTDAKYAKD